MIITVASEFVQHVHRSKKCGHVFVSNCGHAYFYDDPKKPILRAITQKDMLPYQVEEACPKCDVPAECPF